MYSDLHYVAEDQMELKILSVNNRDFCFAPLNNISCLYGFLNLFERPLS